MTKRLVIFVGAFLFIAAQVLGFCFVPGTDIAFFLAVGWVLYLRRVLPEMSVRWDLVASAAVYVVLLAAGGHLFLRWLYWEMKRADAPTETPPPWKWRWTLGGLAVVLLMFAAGTAAVGITHQTAWLVRSPETLYRKGNARRDRVYCASNLRQIGQGLQLYAAENGGRLPDDLRSLMADGFDLEARILVCPAIAGDQYTAATQAVAEGRHEHRSYIYFGRGLTNPDRKQVLVVELLENHEGEGINVLYGDGHAEWIDRPEAERLLLELGFTRVEGPPASR